MASVAAIPPLYLDPAPLIGRRPPLGPRARAASLAFGSVLLWATWPTLAMVASPAPPLLVIGLAASIGFVVALGLALFKGTTAGFVSVAPGTLVLVAAGLLSNSILFLLAMARIGPAEANVITYLWPVLLVAILAFTRRERLGGMRIAGIAVAFLGAVVVIGPSFERGFDATGIVLAFLGGLAFAVFAAIRAGGRETSDVIGPSMALVAILALGLHGALETPAALTGMQWLAIAGIGIAPMTLFNALWDRAVRTGHTATISAIAYLTPLASLLLLAAFGVGTVTAWTMLGALLVVMGALAASGVLRAEA